MNNTLTLMNMSEPFCLEQELVLKLDAAESAIKSGLTFCAFESLLPFLASIMKHEPDTWRAVVDNICLTHSLAETLKADPITRRSCEKPRGYPGDAELLDLIYAAGDYQNIEAKLEGSAKAIYQNTYSSYCGRAVRFRRHMLAEMIDRTSTRVTSAHIASIAAGHLREAESSSAVRHGRLGRFVAFDQDEQSLERISTDQGKSVECIRGTVKELLVGKVDLGSFDLIYSAGLLDYLPDAAAKALIQRMFGMLRPGGELLIGNFKKGVQDAAYLDSFMKWHLLYRDGEDMQSLLSALPAAELSRTSIFDDYLHYVVYASVRKIG